MVAPYTSNTWGFVSTNTIQSQLCEKPNLKMFTTWPRIKRGGLDRVSIETNRSQHWQKVSLDNWENLNTFKMLVLTIKIFWFCSTSIYKSVFLDLDLSRLFTSLWISWLFLDLHQEIMDFYKNLVLDFSSQHFFVYILYIKMGKKCEYSNFWFKNAKTVPKVSKKVEKSQKVLTQQSWFILTISIKILKQINLESRFIKMNQDSWILKNLDQDKKKSCLNVRDNLDSFQKLISTNWEISVLIGLDCRDQQPYHQ